MNRIARMVAPEYPHRVTQRGNPRAHIFPDVGEWRDNLLKDDRRRTRPERQTVVLRGQLKAILEETLLR